MATKIQNDDNKDSVKSDIKQLQENDSETKHEKRICKTCNESKNIEHYYYNTSAKTTRHRECKRCINDRRAKNAKKTATYKPRKMFIPDKDECARINKLIAKKVSIRKISQAPECKFSAQQMYRYQRQGFLNRKPKKAEAKLPTSVDNFIRANTVPNSLEVTMLQKAVCEDINNNSKNYFELVKLTNQFRKDFTRLLKR